MRKDNTFRVLQLVDHDAQFEFNANQASVDPVVLNRFDLSSANYIDRLSELIFSDGGGIDFIAKCQCGETEGNNRIGTECPVCHTLVSKSHLLDENHLVCKNWVSCPKDLPGGWISPKIYLNLVELLSYDRGHRNYLDDILDVTTPIPFELSDVVTGKGFGYFHDNFDRIMDYFFFHHPTISKKADITSMRYCLATYRDRIFCHYIPILNSAINPIFSPDNNGANRKRYSDVTADHILKAIESLSRWEFTTSQRNRHYNAEKTIFKAYKDIIAYGREATKKYISTKKAIPRTHIYGSRFHWSFRGVVVPITEPHMYYELHIPWAMAVNTLRVHILGYLMRAGFSPNEAYKKHRRALQMVDPDIQSIMNLMIEESPFPGIPCLWDRPPSIRDGSVMLKYWTKIKTDLNDSCVGVCPIDAALPNLDFDGDENNTLKI